MTDTETHALSTGSRPPGRGVRRPDDAGGDAAWLADDADADLAGRPVRVLGADRPGRRARPPAAREAEAGRLLRFAWHLAGRDTDVRIALEPPTGPRPAWCAHARRRPPAEGAEPRCATGGTWRSTTSPATRGPRPGAARRPHRGPGGSIRCEIDIEAAPAEVWRTLVEPAQLDRWIAERATVQPEVGGAYDFGWDHGPMRILELEPRAAARVLVAAPGRPRHRRHVGARGVGRAHASHARPQRVRRRALGRRLRGRLVRVPGELQAHARDRGPLAAGADRGARPS